MKQDLNERKEKKNVKLLKLNWFIIYWFQFKPIKCMNFFFLHLNQCKTKALKLLPPFFKNIFQFEIYKKEEQ